MWFIDCMDWSEMFVLFWKWICSWWISSAICIINDGDARNPMYVKRVIHYTRIFSSALERICCDLCVFLCVLHPAMRLRSVLSGMLCARAAVLMLRYKLEWISSIVFWINSSRFCNWFELNWSIVGDIVVWTL